ncbi:hypothetical protein [Gandjariella thermophila]|uniref:hypothetical protein n=1 Tax=Gandjariella thermophila TaxID=1931992 RepID=UPI0010F90C2F|nr:hypothetical protein [Gandjariella thermophila]
MRDQDNDAGVGADAAIAEAQEGIAASTGYELYIHCAQDLLKVHATLEIWDDTPYPDSQVEQWGTPRTFRLECPSGEMSMGTPTGEAIGADLPAGPGIYTIDLTHRGRDEADRLRKRIMVRYDTIPLDQLPDELEPHAGIEQYRIRMWWHAPLPEEDDEDLDD